MDFPPPPPNDPFSGLAPIADDFTTVDLDSDTPGTGGSPPRIFGLPPATAAESSFETHNTTFVSDDSTPPLPTAAGDLFSSPPPTNFPSYPTTSSAPTSPFYPFKSPSAQDLFDDPNIVGETSYAESTSAVDTVPVESFSGQVETSMDVPLLDTESLNTVNESENVFIQHVTMEPQQEIMTRLESTLADEKIVADISQSVFVSEQVMNSVENPHSQTEPLNNNLIASDVLIEAEVNTETEGVPKDCCHDDGLGEHLQNVSLSELEGPNCEAPATNIVGSADSLFSSLPPPTLSAPVDPFGAPPVESGKVQNPFAGPPTSAAPLAASELFGGNPPMKDPFAVTSSAHLVSGADSLFSTAPPSAVPVRKIIPKVIPTTGPPITGTSASFGASPFDSVPAPTNVAPVSVAKIALKVSPSTGAADLFSSGGATSSLFGPTPDFGAPPTHSVTNPTSNAASSLFSATPSSVSSTKQTSPSRKPEILSSSTAADLFGSAPSDVSPFESGFPVPFSSGDLSPPPSILTPPVLKISTGQVASPTKAMTPKAVTPKAVPVMASGAADLFGSSSGSHDLFAAPLPQEAPVGAVQPPPMKRSISAPVVAPPTQPAPQMIRTQTAGVFPSAASEVFSSTVAPTSLASVSIETTPVTIDSAPPSSSSNSGKSISKSTSSGAIFKGKAALVTNASPFDAPAPFGGSAQKDLFPQAAASANPFDAIPAPALPPASGAKPTAWDIFSNKLPPSAVVGQGVPVKTSNPADLFAAAPPSTIAAPTPVPVGTKPAGGSRATMNAAEIFSRIPPPNKNPVIDFSAPPPAPGVKVAPRTAAVAIPAAVQSVPSNDPVSPAPVAREAIQSPVKAPQSTKVSNKNKLPAHLLNAIPGAMPTPHGLVAPPSTSNVPPAATLSVFGAPGVTPAPPTYKVNATPLVNPNKLTSLVQVVPEEELNEKPPVEPTTEPIVESSPTPQATYVKGRYIKPSGAIVAFGFGGKCLTMIPNSNRCPPVYISASKQAQNSVGIRPSPIKAFRLVDLMGRYSRSFYTDHKALSEVMHWKKLVEDFPMESSATANAKDYSDQFEQKIIQFIREFASNPSCDVLKERLVTIKTGLFSAPSSFGGNHGTTAATKATNIVHDLVESERLLWSIMEVVVRFHGQLSSSKGSIDPNSPENALVQLLLQQHQHHQAQSSQFGMQITDSPWASFHPETKLGSSSSIEIEQMLVAGRRDDALALAIDRQDWALALMLASIAGADKYQEVTKLYAEQAFPNNSALQLLSLVYSNQAQKFLATNGQLKPKATLNAPSSQGGNRNPPGQPKFISTHGMIDGKIVVESDSQATQLGDPAKTMGIYGQWRYHLAALLSNKTSDWESLVRVMGNRLLVDYDDHYAAAVSYVVSNVTAGYINPSTPAEEMFVDMSLIGNERSPHNPGTATSRLLADCLSIGCLRRSEIVEFALSKQLSSNTASELDDGSGKGGLASSVFGWFTSSNSGNSNTNSGKGSKDGGKKEAFDQERLERFERLTKLRVALCPHKVRFAMILADYGLSQQALNYAKVVNQLVKDIHDDFVIPPNKRKYIFYTASPFPKKFVRALEELLDRFGLSQSPDGTKVESNPTTKSNGASLWGLSSVISTNTLKEIMDGPANAPPTGPAVGPPPVTGPPLQTTVAGPPKSSVPPPMMGNPYVPVPFPSTQPSQGPPAAPGTALPPTAFPPQQQSLPPAVASAVPIAPPAGNATAPQSMGFPPMPAGRKISQRAPNPVTGGPFDQQAAAPPSATVMPTQFNPAPVSTPSMGPALGPAGPAVGPNPSVFVPGSWSAAGPHHQQQQPMQTQPTPQPQQPAPAAQQQPPVTQPTQENGGSKSPVPAAKAATKQDKDNDPLGAGQTGLVGNLRKGLMQWFYPDAKDASENIGKSLEAYYDEKLGRWIFPGEEDAAQNSAALKPPPTGPMPGAVTAGPSTGVGGPPGPSAPAPAEAANAPYDPLAALMAPPPRAMPAPGPSMADDPLAAMMAPPPSRIPGRPSMGGGMMPPAGGAPPIGGGTGGPPPSTKFNVWKPPAAANPAPAVSAFYIPPTPEPAPAQEPPPTETVPPPGTEGSVDPNLMPPPTTSSYMYAMPPPPTDLAPPEAF